MIQDPKGRFSIPSATCDRVIYLKGISLMRKSINEGTARAMVLFVLMLGCPKPVGEWKPDMDWGHWRLGQRSRLEFLKENRFTLTFGSGAPLFENVSARNSTIK